MSILTKYEIRDLLSEVIQKPLDHLKKSILTGKMH